MPVRLRASNEQFFHSCVTDAVKQIQRACPRALSGVDVGIEDVPTIEARWAPTRVPLAAAVEPTVETNGQVVVYRRPLERRAATRKGPRILVFRTLVEQISGITGIGLDELDPNGHRDTDDD